MTFLVSLVKLFPGLFTSFFSIKNFSKSAAEDLLKNGDSAMNCKKWDKALKEYEKIIRRFSDVGERSPLEKIGKLLNELTSKENIGFRGIVAKAYLGKGNALIELIKLGNFKERLEEAFTAYKEVIDEKSVSSLEMVVKAYLGIGEVYLLEDKSEKARETYQEIRDNYRDKEEVKEEVIKACQQIIRIDYNGVMKAIEEGDFSKAEIVCEEWVKLIKSFQLESSCHEVMALAFLGLAKIAEKEHELAFYEKCFNEIEKITKPISSLRLAKACVEVGDFFIRKSNCSQAVKCYEKVISIPLISIPQNDEKDSFRKVIAEAYLGRGNALIKSIELDCSKKVSCLEEGFEVYKSVVKKFSDFPEIFAKACLSKRDVLVKLNRFGEAFTVYEEIIKRFKKTQELLLKEYVAKAFIGKGYVCCKQNNKKEMLRTYLEMVKKFEKAEESNLREQVGKAHTKIVKAFNEKAKVSKDFESASRIYKKLFSRFESKFLCNNINDIMLTVFKESVKKCLFAYNKAYDFYKRGMWDEALVIYENIICLYEKIPLSHRKSDRLDIWTSLNKGRVFNNLGRYKEVAEICNLVWKLIEEREIRIIDIDKMLFFLQESALSELIISESGYWFDDIITMYDKVIERYKDNQNNYLYACSLYQKANVLCEFGDWDEACRVYKQCEDLKGFLFSLWAEQESKIICESKEENGHVVKEKVIREREKMARELIDDFPELSQCDSNKDCRIRFIQVSDDFIERFKNAQAFLFRKWVVEVLCKKWYVLLGDWRYREDQLPETFIEFARRFKNIKDRLEKDSSDCRMIVQCFDMSLKKFKKSLCNNVLEKSIVNEYCNRIIVIFDGDQYSEFRKVVVEAFLLKIDIYSRQQDSQEICHLVEALKEKANKWQNSELSSYIEAELY
ncbi:MAG: tetratricopeptide repeat protein [Acetobacter sp.]|nr:tetratricopeptide repeat protein [Acetobacter sp.]